LFEGRLGDQLSLVWWCTEERNWLEREEAFQKPGPRESRRVSTYDVDNLLLVLSLRRERERSRKQKRYAVRSSLVTGNMTSGRS
jgi:hypothetical protein